MARPPDLQQFATAAVAAGHYRDVREVVAAGVGMLRSTLVQRTELLAAVEAAQAQGERDGVLTIDDVMCDADALIDELAGVNR